MASLYPCEPTVEPPERDGAVLELTDGTAGTVLDALASGTTREVLARLDAEPAPASELADAVGTSLQNVEYHLEKLLEAGLVEEVDTWYSSRGTEMPVYAPTVDRLTVRLETDDRSDAAAE